MAAGQLKQEAAAHAGVQDALQAERVARARLEAECALERGRAASERVSCSVASNAATRSASTFEACCAGRAQLQCRLCHRIDAPPPPPQDELERLRAERAALLAHAEALEAEGARLRASLGAAEAAADAFKADAADARAACGRLHEELLGVRWGAEPCFAAFL
jgi:hypothetical protein